MCFIFLYSCLGMIATGMTAAGLTSLEKRFKLSSKQTGMIIAANDVSALLLIIFISYFGGHRNKARWLGIGALVTSLGCLLFALPHVLVGKYTPLQFETTGTGDTCLFNTTGILRDEETCAEAKGYTAWKYMLVFIGAKLLLGAGTTPLFTLGPAYIDENVNPKVAPMYLGVWFTATFFGPGIGYVAGGSLLNVWVDLIQVRRSNPLLSTSHFSIIRLRAFLSNNCLPWVQYPNNTDYFRQTLCSSPFIYSSWTFLISSPLELTWRPMIPAGSGPGG